MEKPVWHQLSDEMFARALEARASMTPPAFPDRANLDRVLFQSGANHAFSLVAKWLAAIHPDVWELYLKEFAYTQPTTVQGPADSTPTTPGLPTDAQEE